MNSGPDLGAMLGCMLGSMLFMQLTFENKTKQNKNKNKIKLAGNKSQDRLETPIHREQNIIERNARRMKSMGDRLCLHIGGYDITEISVFHDFIPANSAIPVKLLAIFFRKNEQVDSKMYTEMQRA